MKKAFNNSRRTFLKSASGFIAASLFSGCTTLNHRLSNQAKPNFIFILTDDQRADTLGCTGNKIIHTPNIDKLARDGVLFENASVTSAICMPSRISYFLGQYERMHGVNFNSGTAVSEKAWQNSYPAILKKAGYFTGDIGKNHCPVGPQGYDSGVMEKAFDYFYVAHGHIGFYLKTDYQRAAEVFKNAKADTQVEIIDEGVMNFLETNDDFVKGTNKFLEDRPKDKPFCLSICFNLPHDCSTEKMKQRESDPEIYKSLYRDIDIPLNENYVAKDDITNTKLPANVLYAEYRQGTYYYVDEPADCKERVLRTYQAVTGIDIHVGHIRKKLKDLGLDKNTIIIYSSDHGIMQGDFGLGGKALNYEKCLNVPIIVYNPLKDAPIRGIVRKELIQSIDIAPTMLDIAGINKPDTMQGDSIMPLLRDKEAGWRKYAFSENLWCTYFGNPRVESVRDERWKYIRYFENDRGPYLNIKEESDKYKMTDQVAARYKGWLDASIKGEKPVYEELFDLQADPQETTNLISDNRFHSILEDLRKVCQEKVVEARGIGRGNPEDRTVSIVPK